MSSEAAGLVKFSEVVEALRLELGALAKEAETNKEALRFEVLGAEVELQVVITKAVEASGKASLAVKWFGSGGSVEAAGGGSYTKAETHKVKLSLKPRALKDGEFKGDLLAGAGDPGFKGTGG